LKTAVDDKSKWSMALSNQTSSRFAAAVAAMSTSPRRTMLTAILWTAAEFDFRPRRASPRPTARTRARRLAWLRRRTDDDGVADDLDKLDTLESLRYLTAAQGHRQRAHACVHKA